MFSEVASGPFLVSIDEFIYFFAGEESLCFGVCHQKLLGNLYTPFKGVMPFWLKDEGPLSPQWLDGNERVNKYVWTAH